MTKLRFKSVVLLLAMCFALSSCRLPFGNEVVDCTERSYQGMTDDELAAAVGLRVLSIDGLPAYINSEPHIGLAVHYPLESPVCGLEMTYFSQDAETLALSIKVFNSDGKPQDWSCLDFPPEDEGDPKHPTSGCSRTLELDGEMLFVLIHSFVDADTTLAIVQKLEWFR